MAEKVNLRKTVVETFFNVLTDEKSGVTPTSLGTLQVSRDDSNPYVLLASIGDKKFKVRIKETDD